MLQKISHLISGHVNVRILGMNNRNRCFNICCEFVYYVGNVIMIIMFKIAYHSCCENCGHVNDFVEIYILIMMSVLLMT